MLRLRVSTGCLLLSGPVARRLSKVTFVACGGTNGPSWTNVTSALRGRSLRLLMEALNLATESFLSVAPPWEHGHRGLLGTRI